MLAATPILCALLALLGVSIAIVPQSAFMDLPRTTVVWGTFFTLLLLAGLGYGAAKSVGESPWITPISLITIIFFVRYGWGAVVVQYWEEYPWRTGPMRWFFHRFGVWQFLPAGCQIILVFGMGMVLGFLLAMQSRRSMLPAFSWPLSEQRLKKMAFVFAPLAAFVNSFLQFELPTSIQYMVSLLGSFMYPLIMLGAYWFFTATNKKERTKNGLFLIASCAATIPVGLITGQVNGLIMPGVNIVLGYIVAKGTPPWKAFAITLPIVFLIVLPFASLYKSSGAQTSDIEQRLEMSFRKFTDSNYRNRLELSLERAVARFAGANMPAVYSRYYPNVYPFEYGTSFLFEASTIVPRILWPDKPIAAYELNHYPAKVGIIEHEGNTTALFDAVSEYYLNFGALGMFVLAILHGYYWQAIYKWLSTKVHVLLAAVLILTMIVQNEDFYGVGLLFTGHVKSLPVWLLLFYVISRETNTDPMRNY
jgi:hypothetical protein